ncbi:MAG: hypothetical protein K0S65_6506 [Labilithrix sp.]|nr:hypothetical protein [Labilithrix sp.]
MKRRAILPSASSALLLTLVAGCGGGAASGGDAREYNACLEAQTKALNANVTGKEAPKGPFSASLLAADPTQLASLVRDDLKANMRTNLESARASRIASVRCEHLRPDPGSGSADAGAFAPAPSADRGGSGAEGAAAVSGTNNQVARKERRRSPAPTTRSPASTRRTSSRTTTSTSTSRTARACA